MTAGQALTIASSGTTTANTAIVNAAAANITAGHAFSVAVYGTNLADVANSKAVHAFDIAVAGTDAAAAAQTDADAAQLSADAAQSTADVANSKAVHAFDIAVAGTNGVNQVNTVAFQAYDLAAAGTAVAGQNDALLYHTYAIAQTGTNWASDANRTAGHAFSIATTGTTDATSALGAAAAAQSTANNASALAQEARDMAIVGTNAPTVSLIADTAYALALVGTNAAEQADQLAGIAYTLAQVGTNAADQVNDIAVSALNTAWAGTNAADNFKDSPDNADAVVYTNGSNEVFRAIGATGFLQLATPAMRIHGRVDTDTFTWIAGPSKATGAFLEVTGQGHASSANVGASVHHQFGTLGRFYVRSAPVDSFSSTLRFEIYGQTGNTVIYPQWTDGERHDALSIVVDDTSSDSSSNLIKCTVDAVEKVAVRKSGDITTEGTIAAINTITAVGTLPDNLVGGDDWNMGTYVVDMFKPAVQELYLTGSVFFQPSVYNTIPTQSHPLSPGATVVLHHAADRDVNITFDADIRFSCTEPTTAAANKISTLTLQALPSFVLGAYSPEP
jgi:hypothetical protein